MPLITRQQKGSKLTIPEMDGNLLYLEGLAQSAGYTYLEIEISSAEILNSNTSPVTLLPQPGANKYYVWNGTFEFTYGTIQYSHSGDLYVGASSLKQGQAISSTMITQPKNLAVSFSSSGYSGSASIIGGLNESIIYKSNTSDPKFGDGTIKIKIYYKIINFG